MYLQIIGPDYATYFKTTKFKEPTHKYTLKGCWNISGFQVFPEILKALRAIEEDSENKLPSVRIAKQLGFSEAFSHHKEKLTILVMYAIIEGGKLSLFVSLNENKGMFLDIIDNETQTVIMTLWPPDWERIIIKNERFHTVFDGQASQEQDILYILDNNL